MTSPEKLRAQAAELYERADAMEDREARVAFVMRAMELEFEADVMQRQKIALVGMHSGDGELRRA